MILHWCNLSDPVCFVPSLYDTQSTNEQDITRCQWLYYGAHIGNETRNIEFKVGGGM